MRTNPKGAVLSFTLGLAIVGAAVASGQAQEVHRVVTSINKDDKSAALFDGQVLLQKGGGGEGFATLWVTQKSPADFSWEADRSGQRKSFSPQNGGSYLLVVDFPPVGPEVDKLPMDT
jgi:hypothetical protein